jgi:hypothetical protein
MRLLVSSFAVIAALAATPAAAADANVVDGVFTGGYTCAQGVTFLELTLDGDYGGAVRGVFRFNSATWRLGMFKTFEINSISALLAAASRPGLS